VETLYDGFGILEKNVSVDAQAIQRIYTGMHEYARSTANFAPEIRAAIAAIPAHFNELAAKVTWGRVDFISDKPGKNASHGLAGGGLSTAELARLLGSAQREVIIQSPYLVVSDPALALFKRVLAKDVRIRIHTNSLASTDNLQAFSGYRNQRQELLDLGIEIFEFKPNPQIQREVMQRYSALRDEMPIFALHAKTMVVDGEVVYIGTYNLDPRSENLNTEVGVVIHNPSQAGAVAEAILRDTLPENSWNAATDDPDQFASLMKRTRASFWQLMPIKPLL
jgi:cardiolipin synthase C